MKNHLVNITWQGFIKAIAFLLVVLASLYLIFQNMAIVAAGGVLLIVAHLLVAGGVIYFAGNLVVQSIIKLHETNPKE